jgi:hypothetical protein
MPRIEGKAFSSPDTTRSFPKGKVDIVKLGDFTVGRLELEPGWKWSESVKPIAGTGSCMAQHTGITISGRMRIVLDDGTEAESGPGEAYLIPPGHDAWIIGDEMYVGIDFTGMSQYAVAHLPAVVPTVGSSVSTILKSAQVRASKAYNYARQRVKRNPPEEETSTGS